MCDVADQLTWGVLLLGAAFVWMILVIKDVTDDFPAIPTVMGVLAYILLWDGIGDIVEQIGTCN